MIQIQKEKIKLMRLHQDCSIQKQNNIKKYIYIYIYKYIYIYICMFVYTCVYT